MQINNSKIIFLTHTNIRADSRILKAIHASKEYGYSVFGIGVDADEGSATSDYEGKEKIQTITLHSRKLRKLPKSIRHILSLIELTVKFLPKCIKFRPNLIHCNDTMTLPLGVFIKLLSGAKLIYDAHELESDRNGLSKMMGRLTYYTEKVLWRFIDSLIVVSPSIQEWYLKNIGSKRSVVILNSPVFTHTDTLNSGYLRSQFKIPHDSKVFIYIGIIGRGRGIEFLIEVFTRPNFKGSVVFLGYGEYSQKIQDLSKVHSNIYFHPAVPHKQVVTIAKSADFGICLIENVSLSDYYSLPNKLFEYIFAGIPVIASNFPDIKKIVTDYKVGICVDMNMISIVNAISAIDNNHCSIEKINPHSLEELGWHHQSKKLISL